MTTRHELTINGVCPLGGTDTYAAVFRTERMIPVEVILETVRVFTLTPVFQEKLTNDLADCLNCEVILTGLHSGVKTTTTAGMA